MKLSRVTKPARLFAASLSVAAWGCGKTNPLPKTPDTGFSSTPALLSRSPSPTFGFFCDNTQGCSFFCSLDGAAESACESPLQLGPLADGPHTFSVRAQNREGASDPSAATHAWTVDTTAPTVTFDGGPLPRSNATSATIVFASNDPGATFVCAMDDAGASPCTSPQTASSLGDGTHTLSVRATDDAGNTGEATVYVWVVDTTAPSVSFDGGPAALTNSATATFAFSGTEEGCTFVCAVDDAGAAPCASSYVVTVGEGAHSVSVRATDDAGNTGDASVYAWTADFVPPQSTVQSVVSLVPYGTLVPLSGTASDGVSGVARVDFYAGGDAGWVQASGTTSWSSAFVASRSFHNVRSRATDVAGNVEAGDAGVTIHTSLIPASAVVGRSLFTSTCADVSAIGLSGPEAVLFEPGSNRLFVTDSSNHRVVVHQLSASNGFVDFAADIVLGRATMTDCATPAISASSMNFPRALAFDRVGNRLFVSDATNNRVLVFSVGALISGQSATNVLGQSTFDASDPGFGPGQFNGPFGVAFDPVEGRLFVADYYNSRVVVYMTGIIVDGESAVSVLGQTGFGSSSCGLAIDRMCNPSDVAYDVAGRRLFVADTSNHRVLAFNLDAGVDAGMAASNVLGQSWFDAGASGVLATAMYYPQGVAFDDWSRLLYVSDTNNHRVLVFDPGVLSDGEPAIAVLGQSQFDAGSFGTSAFALSYPRRLSLDADAGRLFVADSSNNRVMVFDVGTLTSGEPAVHALGHADVADAASPIYDSACSNGPGQSRITYYAGGGVAVDRVGGRLFVSADNDHRVLVFSVDDAGFPQSTAAIIVGQPDFSHCVPKSGASGQSGPNGLAFDPGTERLFVADSYNNRVLVYSTAALVSGAAATAVLGQTDFDASVLVPVSETTFNAPKAVAIDSARARLFVADYANHRVMVFNIDGGITNGMAASYYLGAGTDFSNFQAATSQNGLRYPTDLAVDVSSGRLFVADSNNHRVLVFETSVLWNRKSASIVLGQDSFSTLGSSSSSTEMNNPTGVVFDPVYSRLFVADTFNNRVLLFDAKALANGMTATNLIGQVDWGSISSGVSQTALNSPRSLATDGTGRWLYVVDRSNGRVLTFDVGP
ncbi:MAG: hypothetical protein HYY84_20095 [Deltaproteobacteria bacterium]|nr:hypothetical protein [Deltaproteobacteria bacterium]